MAMDLDKKYRHQPKAGLTLPLRAQGAAVAKDTILADEVIATWPFTQITRFTQTAPLLLAVLRPLALVSASHCLS